MHDCPTAYRADSSSQLADAGYTHDCVTARIDSGAHLLDQADYARVMYGALGGGDGGLDWATSQEV